MGKKSLYGAQVGPKWDKCPESAHMVPIYTCLLVSLPIWDLYRSYMGKKSLYGAHAWPERDKCPDSAHMGPIYTCLLGSLWPCPQGLHQNSECVPPVLIHRAIACDSFSSYHSLVIKLSSLNGLGAMMWHYRRMYGRTWGITISPLFLRKARG